MFSDDSDVEDIQLTINEHYAKAYESRKEREELAKRASVVLQASFPSMSVSADQVLQSKKSMALTWTKTTMRRTRKTLNPRTKMAKS